MIFYEYLQRRLSVRKIIVKFRLLQKSEHVYGEADLHCRTGLIKNLSLTFNVCARNQNPRQARVSAKRMLNFSFNSGKMTPKMGSVK